MDRAEQPPGTAPSTKPLLDDTNSLEEFAELLTDWLSEQGRGLGEVAGAEPAPRDRPTLESFETLEGFTEAVILWKLERRKLEPMGVAERRLPPGDKPRIGDFDSLDDFTEAIVAWRLDFRGLREAAGLGDVHAQFALGTMYDLGKGIPMDQTEAVVWLRRAANQGHAQAQDWLGDMHRGGDGVVRDPIEAAVWYRKAAEQGNSSAQFSLAWMYENGEGVVQDHARAAAWYRLAADRDRADAMASREMLEKRGVASVPGEFRSAQSASSFPVPTAAVSAVSGAQPNGKRPFNWVQGVFRLWVVVSSVWAIPILGLGASIGDGQGFLVLALGPPALLWVLGLALIWAVKGFKAPR